MSLPLRGPHAALDTVGIWVQVQDMGLEEQPREGVSPTSRPWAKPRHEQQSHRNLAWPRVSAPRSSTGHQGLMPGHGSPANTFRSLLVYKSANGKTFSSSQTQMLTGRGTSTGQ